MFYVLQLSNCINTYKGLLWKYDEIFPWIYFEFYKLNKKREREE